jgi:hypothetical protein
MRALVVFKGSEVKYTPLGAFIHFLEIIYVAKFLQTVISSKNSGRSKYTM